MAERRIRYGIIGFGSFAERAIAPAIKSSHNSELVALQKRSLDAAREKAAAMEIPLAFDSAEELVSHPDVDAVFIVSANAAHYRETIAAARAGKHVLVEKPMALNVQEAKAMIEACREHGVKLMVGHMIRLSPLVQRVRGLVLSGGLGDASFAKAEFFYDARLTKRPWLTDPRVAGGGPLFDIGVHCIDTLRFLLDDEVASVTGHLRPLPSPDRTELSAGLTLRFTRGTLGSIFCSYEAPTRRSFIEVIGTEGMASAYDFTLGDRTIPLRIAYRKDGIAIDEHLERIAVPNLYLEEVTRFSESILRGTESPIPGSEGLANQIVLDAALSWGEDSRK